MVPRLWLAAGLTLLVTLGSLAILPVAQAHPFHLQIENGILSLSNRIDNTRWRAQSIVPDSNFFVSRISLYVIDEGLTDSLQVAIRQDELGFPDVTNITAGSADGPAVAGWVDFDVDPRVELVAGQTYWIVAHSTMPQGDGYEWWDSGTDLAYPAGTGANSDDGLLWTPAAMDFAFRVYGFQQPSFAFAVTPSVSSLKPGEAVVFRIDFDNQGPGSSAALWVNVSLPPELTYVGDDADLIGGVWTAPSNYSFTDVAPGLHSFNLTASAAGGTPDGTLATTNFTFDPQDHNGQPLPQETQGVPITVDNARLDLSLGSSATAVDPGDRIVLTATVTNNGSAPAQNLRVEGLVDPNATYVSSVPSATYDATARAVRWNASILDEGAQAIFEWTVEVNPGTPDLATATFPIRVDYEDLIGAPLPSVETSVQSGVRVPSFAPVVRLDRDMAERGEEVSATLYYNNTGSGTARWAWANWSLGGFYELVALEPSLSYVTTPDGFDVALTNLTPNPYALLVRLRVTRGLEDGLALGFQVDWAVSDGNGNPLLPATRFAAVELYAPSVAIDLRSESGQVEATAVFTVNLTLRNLGRAPARSWLNLTLPSGIAYLGDNGTIPPTIAGDRVAWTLTTLAPGSSLALGIELQGKGELGVRSLRFALNFTDEGGSLSKAVFSNGVSVEFVPGGLASTTFPWWSLGFLLLAIPGAAYLVIRRRRSTVVIEEVFVVDTAGILLAHRSNSIVQYTDEDLVVAMFTAIQTYVRNVFSHGTEEEMRGLEFGERSILIESGQHHYIAAVHRGKDRGELKARVRRVSQEIDRQFGEILAEWDGNVETIQGIASVLPHVWGAKVRRKDSERGANRPGLGPAMVPGSGQGEDPPR